MTPHEENAPLSPEDQAALDALVEGGWDDSQVPEPLRERARRLTAMMSLMDGGTAWDARALIDAAAARVFRAERVGPGEPELSAMDAEALDAWVLAGHDAERVPSFLRERARRHAELSSLVTASTQLASNTDLITRTLARVERDAQVRSERMRFETAAPRWRVRLTDVVSVAAVLLIGISVVFPVLQATREQGRQRMCQANFGMAAGAFGQYANAHEDMLPMATAGFGSRPWWNVGRSPETSNSANLFQLIKEQFLAPKDLACAGNPDAAQSPEEVGEHDWRHLEDISYSYQIIADKGVHAWDGSARTVILADRSPVILRAVRRQTVYPLENSPNHNGSGQATLRVDGSGGWSDSPVLESGDNIWLPRGLERAIEQVARRAGLEPLSGREVPEDDRDVFLGP